MLIQPDLLIVVKYFRRWYFYVQMVGYEEEAQCYSMEMTICRPDEGERDGQFYHQILTNH